MDVLFKECCNFPTESEAICKYLTKNFDFSDDIFLSFLENVFIYCDKSYRKLLSPHLLKNAPKSSQVKRLYNLKLLSTNSVRRYLNVCDYIDIDDTYCVEKKDAIIIIYNRYDK